MTKLEYILNKGEARELELDLLAVSQVVELLPRRYEQAYVNEVVGNLTSCIGTKYNISDKEIKMNYMLYQANTLVYTE
jgi:hypothetical protein